jgi:CBS-domain-containing membrane protein
MNARQLMTRDVVTCAPDDPLSHAARLMWENDIGCLPVVGLGGKLVGMLTDRDVCMAAYTRDRPLSELPVSGAMAEVVHACSEDEPLEKVAALMRDHQVHRVPVTDWAQRVVGVVSLNDIAQRVDPATEAPADDLSAAALARTLAAIMAPRTPHAAAS